jgi:uncharacterized LabA/DUF88 family protein
MENTTSKNIAYIDGANLHRGVTDLGWKLDYKRFRVWLTEKYKISTAKVFLGEINGHKDIYSKINKAGFTVLFKETIRTADGKIKGNCDAELVVEAMKDYYEKISDGSVIVTSDGDFSVLAKFLINKSALVSIISPRNSCSYLLRNLNSPLLYLDTQRQHLEKLPKSKEALGGNETPQRSSS